jgi:hypothetical protein
LNESYSLLREHLSSPLSLLSVFSHWDFTLGKKEFSPTRPVSLALVGHLADDRAVLINLALGGQAVGRVKASPPPAVKRRATTSHQIYLPGHRI